MFFMSKIKIVRKMGSFIHVLECISAKVVVKIRESVHESERVPIRSEIIYHNVLILNSIFHVNTG